MKLPICDITPFTLQDFPDHTACILWFGGCNMRCGYCHNPELVLGKKERLSWREVKQFLEERRNLLDGVVLSGGECTLSPDLVEFVKYIRRLGYKVKLDTNGMRPDVVASLLEGKLLDYVALDYKAPRKKFFNVTGKHGFGNLRYSLELLCHSGVELEVRTTVHTALLDEDDIAMIVDDLAAHGFCGNYYLQNFQSAPEMLGPLPPQTKTLDITAIKDVAKFAVYARNF